MSARKPGPKSALNREVFIKTALALVDRDGLDALSMRRLGAELGVDPMAAYRHFPNKDALLDGVVEAVVSEVDLTVDGADPWPAQIACLARAYRAALLAHPAVAPLAASRPLATPGALRIAERSLEILERGGVPRHQAILAVNTIGILVNGVVQVETATGRSAPSAPAQRDALAALSPEEFPRITDLMASGEMVTSYDEMVGFAVGAVTSSLGTGA